MSYTIVEQPQAYTPAYNDTVFILRSSNSGEPKYRYVMDLQIIAEIDPIGSYTVNLGRFKVVPQLNKTTITSDGFFNFKDVLKYAESLSSYPGLLQFRAFYLDVKYGEEYAASATGTPSYTQTATGSFIIFNGALSPTEFELYDYTDFINKTIASASSGIGLSQLTSLLSGRTVLMSTQVQLGYFVDGYNIEALVTYYNASGSIGTQVVPITTTDIYLVVANVGPADLNVPDGATRYTVQVRRVSNGNAIAPLYEFNIDSGCTVYERVTVYYQNKYGVEDCFVFSKKSFKNTDINRSDYQVSEGLNTTEGDRTYNSRIGTKHRLNTDWLTEQEWRSLGELVESNNVFIAFDGEVTLGNRAEITLTFSQNQDEEWNIDTATTFTGTTGYGSRTFTVPTSATVYSFADDLYNAEIEPVILASNWMTNYDLVEVTVDSSTIIVKLVAKLTGAAGSITPTSVLGQVAASNNTPGVDQVLPQRIPVNVDNTSYDYKKVQNETQLFQLELNVTERATYERQVQ